jgi:hypothetical protein
MFNTGEKNVQYLTLCLDHPELEGFELLAGEKEAQETGLDIKKLTLFAVLITLLEMGFLLYQRYGGHLKREWQDWHTYSAIWVRREDFRKAWSALGPQFKKNFYNYMDQLIRENAPQSAQP